MKEIVVSTSVPVSVSCSVFTAFVETFRFIYFLLEFHTCIDKKSTVLFNALVCVCSIIEMIPLLNTDIDIVLVVVVFQMTILSSKCTIHFYFYIKSINKYVYKLQRRT